MDNRVQEYRAILEAAMRRLEPHITAAHIVGSDMAQFLVVHRYDRGVETYGDDESAIVLDPFVG